MQANKSARVIGAPSGWFVDRANTEYSCRDEDGSASFATEVHGY